GSLPPGTELVGDSNTRYELEEKIGEGGMGHVYRARADSGWEQAVAVQFIIRPTDTGDEHLRRFGKEVKSLKRIVSPHVALLLDTGSGGGRAFLVMEFVPGRDLARVLADQPNGRFPLAQVVEILEQAWLGLTAGHNENIVHRDVKPQNLMIFEPG